MPRGFIARPPSVRSSTCVRIRLESQISLRTRKTYCVGAARSAPAPVHCTGIRARQLASALDVDTEHELLTTLHAARLDRLVILITHRLAAARTADLILFLDHGHLIESGTHQTLMRRPDGAYRRFVELQVHGT